MRIYIVSSNPNNSYGHNPNILFKKIIHWKRAMPCQAQRIVLLSEIACSHLPVYVVLFSSCGKARVGVWIDLWLVGGYRVSVWVVLGLYSKSIFAALLFPLLTFRDFSLVHILFI
jgi:hypothetical protein